MRKLLSIYPVAGTQNLLNGLLRSLRGSLAAVLCLGLVLGGCAPTTPQAVLASPIPPVAVQDARTALATYQAALGVAEVAVSGNPALAAKVAALKAQAAPYVALIEQGVAAASTAQTVSGLAAQLLIAGAAYIVVTPNGVK